MLLHHAASFFASLALKQSERLHVLLCQPLEYAVQILISGLALAKLKQAGGSGSQPV